MRSFTDAAIHRHTGIETSGRARVRKTCKGDDFNHSNGIDITRATDVWATEGSGGVSSKRGVTVLRLGKPRKKGYSLSAYLLRHLKGELHNHTPLEPIELKPKV